ncbi:THUMP-like domain-containing protein [Nesterenkonia aerolata]|uniref:SAM-dependent methyltransferase n=1 Tax=Nesterenkonia aerolata TaxID=3074079 RepID=A0ABU2DTP7_9MICC|nr:SAM-dependent methyltransferase [Nesterenkonia sp. LY-0111]MDR8019877.1 SAM-dependent methyltransferase [Nesterenkonia sp. LY-0111]
MSDSTASPPSLLAPVLTTQGWELLASLPSYDADESFTLNQRLRRQGHPAETVAAALTQSRLRAAAATKFGQFAARMLFTEDGLQQATRLDVAARHARRFHRAGITTLADLGCGIGGDALAAAASGLQVIAVESDETTAAAATINLSPFPEAQVCHGTAEEFLTEELPRAFPDPSPGASPEASPAEPSEPAAELGLWLDPARRDPHAARSADGAAHRLSDPETFSPPLSLAQDLAAAGHPVGVKLGPGIAHEQIPRDCEAEWVSIDGDVVEVALWFGTLTRPGVRRAATVLRQGQPAVELTSSTDFSPQESGSAEPDPANPHLRGTDPTPASAPSGPDGLHGILWEPDGAVIRAGLVADCAELFGGWLLDRHIAYFCTTEDTQAPPEAQGLARGYRILETMAFNVKTLKRWAAEQEVTRVEIKKRGVDITPERLRQQILPPRRRGAQARAATLVVTRVADQRIVAVVEPLG